MESDSPAYRKHPVHHPAIERDNQSIINFVTVCTKDRRPILANALAHQALKLAWKQADSYLVGRYVIMPDHIHFFCSPADPVPPPFTRWMQYWKSLTARSWPISDGAKLWQSSYWDVQLRRGESYSAKWEYIRQNPVRAGLVEKSSQWPHQGEMHPLTWHDQV